MEKGENRNEDSEPKIEEKDKIQSYDVQFDDSHFGETIRPLDTLELVGEMNNWWENICFQNNWDPEDKKWENVDYYMMELGKNVLEYGKGGKIKLEFYKDKIIVVVIDNGPGFENPNYDILHLPIHGLSEVIKFADEFAMETNGKKFTKVKRKRKLVESGDTDIQHGTKITFTKNFKK